MSRLFSIAVREYLAYVRTFGFWLSLLLLPVGLASVVMAPAAISRSTPPTVAAVVDFTAQRLGPAVSKALSEGDDGHAGAKVITAPGAPFTDPADAARRLKPYLMGSAIPAAGQRLDAAVILSDTGDTVAVDVWSRNVGDQQVRSVAAGVVTDALRRQSLAKRGVDASTLNAIDSLRPHVNEFSPKAAAGRVSLKDRLPAFAGFAMAMLLWMVVLTGASLLLNSVMEEKSSRILEVLLTSATVPEIMGGKIIGVAAVTGTVLAFWMTIAGAVVAARSPEIAADVVGILLTHGHWAYFALYLAGGYMMFSTLFVTIGAFCETAREAQTLLGPMMVILSGPMFFIGQSVSHPDAPILHMLSWVPLFTPFMMAARVATDPPLWEIAATTVIMAAVTGLELMVAIPAFRNGAVASGRFDIRAAFRGLMAR